VAEVDVVRVVVLGIGLVGVLAAAGQVVRARGERPLAPFSLVIGAAGLAASAGLSVLLPPIAFKTPVLWALLVGGALMGLLAGRAVRVGHGPRGVLVRGGAWHLLPASLALAGLQVAAFANTIDGVVVATAAIVACTAFAVASGALVLLRGSVVRLRAPSVAASLPARSSVAASLPAPSTRAPAAAPAAPPATPLAVSPVRISCSACGAGVQAGWRHCVTCGATLAWG
jgi:hypothetical protein